MDRQQAIWLIKDHMEHHKIGEYPHILLGEALNMAIAALSPPNEPMTLEQLRASPHGKIKDSTLQSICNRANEIACRPSEGEEEA